MKRNYFIIILLFLASCATEYKEIGQINMISNRNIETSKKYELLRNYTGASPKEIKKARAKSIQEAINVTVSKVIGGEYLMNAKMYIVEKKYYCVEGDVYGNKVDDEYNGFKLGQKVTWKSGRKFITGVIFAIKDKATFIVTADETNKNIELNIKELSKVSE